MIVLVYKVSENIYKNTNHNFPSWYIQIACFIWKTVQNRKVTEFIIEGEKKNTDK